MKIESMIISDRALENISNIIKVEGFFIKYVGDKSEEIRERSWTLRGNFYFDNNVEVEVFRNGLKKLYENYIDIVEVKTFEEYNNGK